MPDKRRKNCGCCGSHERDVGPISWQGNCRRCGQLLMVENIVGIATRTGPAHKRRLRGIIKAAERELLDGSVVST